MDRRMSFIQFKSIVCGVDFSRHSASALRYAAALARVKGGSLTVVYAVDPVLSTAAAAAYDSREIADNARPELDRYVRATLRRQRVPSPRLIVAVGKTVHALLSTAERCGADLVVVGTHGLTGLKKVLFGSTTEAILRRSRLPVLAVPHIRRPLHAWRESMLVLTLPQAGPVVRFLEAAAAYRLVRHARCPVLVLHLTKGRHARRRQPRSRLRRVA